MLSSSLLSLHGQCDLILGPGTGTSTGQCRKCSSCNRWLLLCASSESFSIVAAAADADAIAAVSAVAAAPVSAVANDAVDVDANDAVAKAKAVFDVTPAITNLPRLSLFFFSDSIADSSFENDASKENESKINNTSGL